MDRYWSVADIYQERAEIQRELVTSNCGYSLFGCDGNLDVTTCFELHIIPVFIS